MIPNYAETVKNTHGIECFRINNDVNGNPRYVVHFLSFGTDYSAAQKTAKRAVGASVYRARWFGGGLVFQSYNIDGDLKEIAKARAAMEEVK